MGLSTHILDTARGTPAAGVGVTVDHFAGETWQQLAVARTDADGRCTRLLDAGEELTPGRYRIRFEIADYFAGLSASAAPSAFAEGTLCLYPYVEIAFDVRDTRYYHIPLLITANGYTTYRGS